MPPVMPVVTRWGKEKVSALMEETPQVKYPFLQYLDEEIEKELLATPSADRCTVMKMVGLVTKEILHAIQWGKRDESTPFPKNPYRPSAQI